MNFYTAEQLITLIKEMDVKINHSLSESERSSGEDQQRFKQNIEQIKNQRDYYLRILQSVYEDSGTIGNVSFTNRV